MASGHILTSRETSIKCPGTNKMIKAETNDIVKSVREVFDKMTEHSERAEPDSFLSYYDNSADFLHVAGDGRMRNYEEFKKICTEYHNGLKEQKITTVAEKINVIDTGLVILAWMGNIVAQFRNGDVMKMDNYAITSVFKKIGDNWKVIHSHESSLPLEIIKAQS